MKLINPENIARPASRYSQGVIVPVNARRVVISGQIGVDPGGSIVKGLEAQMRQCWSNLFAVLDEAGMTKHDLVKIVVYATRSGIAWEYRRIRDEML